MEEYDGSLRIPTTSNSGQSACALRCGQFASGQLDPLAQLAVAPHLVFYLSNTVYHGRMVSPAERLTDLDELHA